MAPSVEAKRKARDAGRRAAGRAKDQSKPDKPVAYEESQLSNPTGAPQVTANDKAASARVAMQLREGIKKARAAVAGAQKNHWALPVVKQMISDVAQVRFAPAARRGDGAADATAAKALMGAAVKLLALPPQPKPDVPVDALHLYGKPSPQQEDAARKYLTVAKEFDGHKLAYLMRNRQFAKLDTAIRRGLVPESEYQALGMENIWRLKSAHDGSGRARRGNESRAETKSRRKGPKAQAPDPAPPEVAAAVQSVGAPADEFGLWRSVLTRHWPPEVVDDWATSYGNAGPVDATQPRPPALPPKPEAMRGRKLVGPASRAASAAAWRAFVERELADGFTVPSPRRRGLSLARAAVTANAVANAHQAIDGAFAAISQLNGTHGEYTNEDDLASKAKPNFVLQDACDAFMDNCDELREPYRAYERAMGNATRAQWFQLFSDLDEAVVRRTFAYPAVSRRVGSRLLAAIWEGYRVVDGTGGTTGMKGLRKCDLNRLPARCGLFQSARGHGRAGEFDVRDPRSGAAAAGAHPDDASDVELRRTKHSELDSEQSSVLGEEPEAQHDVAAEAAAEERTWAEVASVVSDSTAASTSAATDSSTVASSNGGEAAPVRPAAQLPLEVPAVKKASPVPPAKPKRMAVSVKVNAKPQPSSAAPVADPVVVELGWWTGRMYWQSAPDDFMVLRTHMPLWRQALLYWAVTFSLCVLASVCYKVGIVTKVGLLYFVPVWVTSWVAVLFYARWRVAVDEHVVTLSNLRDVKSFPGEDGRPYPDRQVPNADAPKLATVRWVTVNWWFRTRITTFEVNLSQATNAFRPLGYDAATMESLMLAARRNADWNQRRDFYPWVLAASYVMAARLMSSRWDMRYVADGAPFVRRQGFGLVP